MVFKDHSNLFGANGGVIFRPEYTRVLCSYAGDGGTRHGVSEGVTSDKGCPLPMCHTQVAEAWDVQGGWCSGQAIDPSNLKDMLSWYAANGKGYNEVIVDAEYHQANLPHSVEAILFDGVTHKAFLDYYGVSAENYPLVYYRPSTMPDMPFYSPEQSGHDDDR